MPALCARAANILCAVACFTILFLGTLTLQDTAVRNICTEESCDSPILVTQEVGILSSPGFDSGADYPDSAFCHWCLKSESGVINVLIEYVGIEFSENCIYDYLQLTEGFDEEEEDEQDTEILRLCGYSSNFDVIHTNATEVTVTFGSDSILGGRGFRLAYSASHNLTREVFRQECWRNLTAGDETFESPAYPSTYLPNQDCWTLVNAPQNDSRIYLAFDLLDLEQASSTCSSNFLEVYDGLDKDSPVLARLCYQKEKEPVKLRSSGRSLLFHFHSDDFVEGQGFLARFSVNGYDGRGYSIGDCFWTEVAPGKGLVTSSQFQNDYPKNAKCEIQLVAPAGHKIKLNVKWLEIENSPQCEADKLQIIDGHTRGDPSLAMLCGYNDTDFTLHSSGNNVLIIFTADDEVEGRGFQIDYEYDIGTVSTTENVQLKLHAAQHFVEVGTVEGNQAYLRCDIQGNTSVEWYIEDKKIEEEVGGAVSGGRMFLEIPNARKSNEGVYRCSADVNGTTLSQNVILSVHADQSACNHSLVIAPENKTISVGDVTHLTCGSSEESGDVVWKKRGLPLNVTSSSGNSGPQILNNGVLYFDHVELRDQGIYTCSYTSSDGCQIEASAYLLVKRRRSWKQLKGFCGRRNRRKREAMGKIIGGNDAVRYDHPWQVMLWKESKSHPFCGGSMINERWVLSAAHCFLNTDYKKYKEIWIKFGKHVANRRELGQIDTKIEFIVSHPEFNNVTMDNDIAMLRTRDHVPFTSSILPVCLGSADLVYKLGQARPVAWVVVTGWGVTQSVTQEELEKVPSGNLQTATVLQEVHLPFVDLDTCRQSVKDGHEITVNMLCAGYKRAMVGDSCKGDSGGPLVYKEGNTSILVGIVSWGLGCAQEGQYGVYTNVARYHNWIHSIGQQ